MVELLLRRENEHVTVKLGEYITTATLKELVLTESTWQLIYEDAFAYGRKLFDTIFPEEQMRSLLASLSRNECLLLVAEDPLIASIPWEYMRDQSSRLLAAHIPFVRALPEQHRHDAFHFREPLEIVAIPVSPVDEERILNVEGEWQHLMKVIKQTTPSQTLTLRRVRPPTSNQVKRTLSRKGSSILHFMGHGARKDGKSFLVFEDARARSHLVDAVDVADALDKGVFLVVLNSCLSAIVSPTEFGNIAHTLVQHGVPYALGMQFAIPDEAALVVSETLYGFLLQGYSVEEAVTRVRNALEEPGKFARAAWLAGIPVLYGGMHESLPPFELTPGQPVIHPSPARLQRTCDLTALPQAQPFLGRNREMSNMLQVLLAPSARGFVLLHGLGGIGKTSLARAVGERVSWYYEDRVLAYSFEPFARLDEHQQYTIDETFADRFYNRLAHFYGIDPAIYTMAALQKAILQQRMYQRSLLVFDNVETLFDTQWRGHPDSQTLIAFLYRLGEGNGTVLLTSRQMLPVDWGEHTIISLSGLSEDAGAALFLASLPQEIKPSAAIKSARQTLSRRVQGHPLSIRLLAARFAESGTGNLETFLAQIEAELEMAEQSIPTSLEDPERQRTLYACLSYSIKRLSPEQEQLLRAASLFQAPFPAEFAEQVYKEEQTLVHLHTLLRFSLLEVSASSRTFPEGELLLFELHAMVRWYIEHHLPHPEHEWHERYGAMYTALLAEAYDNYDNNDRLRTLVNLTLADGESAVHYLDLSQQSRLACFLAKPYERLGQNRRTLALYEQALEIDQQLGDIRSIASTQQAMASVLLQQGKPGEALTLYEQSLHTSEQLEDQREVAITQGAMANVLVQQGKPQEALALYEQSLHTSEQLSDVRGITVTQHAMAGVLMQQGKPKEALELYNQSLSTSEQLGEVRGIAVTQHAIADVLVQQGKPQEALELYEQSLHTSEQLGDVRGIAVIQHTMADVLVQQGKPQEALELYEQSLHTSEQLEDLREIAIIQHAMADVLVQQGKPQEALELYEQSLHTSEQLGDIRSIAATQQVMANILVQRGKPQEALELYEQSLHASGQLEDLHEIAVIQHAMANALVKQGKPQEALTLYEQSLHTSQQLGEVRSIAATQHAMAGVLVQQGKPQEALALYEQSLHTSEQLGDTRSTAITQGAMADVLMQQGRPQEALALYEEALNTSRQLGDVRSIAVAQYAIAGVLVQQGRPQEALELYEQSLHTSRRLGDVHSIASTQHAMAGVLMRQGKPQEALALYEQSLHISEQSGDARSTAVTQGAMADVLVQQGKLPEALALYEQSLYTSEQLGDIRSIAITQANLCQLLLQLVAVPSSGSEKDIDSIRSLGEKVYTLNLKKSSVNALGELSRALLLAWDAYTNLLRYGYERDSQTMQRLLFSMKWDLLGASTFDKVWQKTLSDPQPDWLKEAAANTSRTIGVSVTVMEAVQAFVSAEDWQATQIVVKEQQEILFRDEVEHLFEQNIAQALSVGRDRWASQLEQYLKLLRACKDVGIEEAFQPLLTARASPWPFETELLEKSITALLGSPQEKMAYLHELTEQANSTTDEQLKDLLQTIQLALFATDFSQLGRHLEGIYAQAWQEIMAIVEARDVDPAFFERLATTTLAVIRSDTSQRSDWRSALVNLLNQATAKGNRNLAALVQALIGLLDADGSPAGLGKNLQGVYAITWRAVIEHISQDDQTEEGA